MAIKRNIKTPKSFFDSFNIIIAGLVNKDIQNKLNPYVPTIEVILSISSSLEKLQTIKFHGKPVRIDPLINSTIPKINEKVKNELTIFFGLKIIKK